MVPEGDNLVLVAIVEDQIVFRPCLAGPPQRVVDPEGDEVLPALFGRAALARPLVALLPVIFMLQFSCKIKMVILILHKGLLSPPQKAMYLISGLSFSRVDLSLSSVSPSPPSWITFTTSSLSALE